MSLAPTSRERCLTEEERVATAHHEAGHAVVGLVLMPERVLGVYVHRRVIQGCLGYLDLDFQYSGRSDASIEGLAVVYAAGMVGEKLGTGSAPPSAGRSDRQAVRESTENHSMFRLLKPNKVKLNEAVQRFQARANNWAETILLTEMVLFAAVSRELCRHNSLRRERLLTLYRYYSTGEKFTPLLFGQ